MSEPAKFNPADHMMNLKGKKYLEVKYRLVWFTEEVPYYSIETEIITMPSKDTAACVRAVVKVFDDVGNVKRTTTGYKTSKGFAGGDIEKAEAGAIGRALAFLGYGTQFAEELDGVDGIGDPVDSPVNEKKGSSSIDDMSQMAIPQVVAALNNNPNPALKAKLQARMAQLKQQQ